jgi:lipoate-protein ligase A
LSLPETVNASNESGAPAVSTSQAYIRADEEFLREGQPVIRVAVLSSAALSVGISQHENTRCIVRARELGLPVVRRSTGGLGLWHAPGDVVWSLVLPRTDPRVGRDFSKAYRRLGTGPVRVLHEHGVTAEWLSPLGLTTEYCLLSGRGAVLSVDGRALGGAAQHLTRQALLHHGVLPFRLDPPRLRELFDLSPELVERSLTCLEQVAAGVSPEEWARRLQAILAAEVAHEPD